MPIAARAWLATSIDRIRPESHAKSEVPTKLL
jgi:hypothetical protein